MRTQLHALIAAALFGAGLTGCTALSSEEGDADGVVYHLPKSVLKVTVRHYHDTATGRVWFTLGGPGKKLNTAAANVDPNYVIVDEREIDSETVPDPLHRYVVKYRPSALSDDRLCISRKPNGLLFDVQFAADDRTPQVIFNVARFIGSFVGAPRTVSFTEKEFGAEAPKVVVKEFTQPIDPFDPASVEQFNADLARVTGHRRLRIDVSRMQKMLARSAKTWPDGCSFEQGCPAGAWARRCDRGHICYRTKLRIPIDLEFDHEAIDMKYAEVINAWDIGAISVTRAFMVQKITKLRFDDGALVSAIVRKPSEVEEVSLVPLNIVNAILSVPSGLWASAFSDQVFNVQILKELNEQQAALAGLNAAVKGAQLSGADPIDATGEKYHLNCGVAKRGPGFFNILSGIAQ